MVRGMALRAGSAMALVAVSLPGQGADAPARARHLARELELPARRAEAGAALLALGEASVAPLLEQARHPDLAVACAALEVLAALEDAGLPAVPELRAMAAGDGDHARAAAWALDRLPYRGTFLVACMESQQVVEVDLQGKVVWRSPNLGKCWSVEGQATGNLLVAEVDGAVREYDRQGRVVWEYTDALRPYDAQRLINGNTLIADFGKREVIEVDPQGEVVWRHGDCTAIAARRLPGRRTLITDYNGNRILELEADGTVLRTIGEVQHAYSGDRLPDGTTVAVLSGSRKALLFDPQGEQVAEVELPANPSHAVRLHDGWVVCGRGYLQRRDLAGEITWRVPLQGWIGRIDRR